MATADKFSALGDQTRFRIIEMLAEESRPVHVLADAFAISRPAISRHLRVLKDAGLIKEEKRGRENVYSLQRQRLKPLGDWLDKFRTRQAKAATRVAKAKPMPAPVPVPRAKLAPIAPARFQMELDF